jgi:hypothetical protein
MRRRSEAGEGQGGCLVGIILMLIAGFVAFKLIPVKVKAAEVRSMVVDEAKSAGTHSDDRIRKAILDKAQEEGLPVTDENIRIERTGNLMRITVEYTVPVVFPGYTYQWHIQHYAENPIF